MSDDFDDLDEDENPDESSVLRKLRKQVRENAGATERAVAAERKLAFVEAGIPNTAKTAYFIRGYDGDMTAEAIQAAAVEAGYLEPPEDDAPDPERASEQAAVERLSAAENGSQDSAPPGYEDELNAAKSPEEVMAVVQKYNIKSVNTG